MQLTSATDRAGLAEEQAALRQVATLVARQPSSEEVFTAVAEAVGPLLGADLAAMFVFPGDGTAAAIAGWTAGGPMLPIGSRLSLDGDGVTARIFHTAAPARIDTYVDVEGETAELARSLGLSSTVGAPIVVDGKLWGALLAATRDDEPLPETTEARLAAFTELVAAAISNVEGRRKLQRLAREQEALQQVATLVASGAAPAEVFDQITASAGDVFGVPFASLIRFMPDATATMVAGCQACRAYVGMSWEVPEDDPGIARTIVKTRKPARIEDHSRVAGPLGEAARVLGVGSVVGAPVVVDGEIWGVLALGAPQAGPPLAADAGERLVAFTELVTTTLMNAEAREEVRSLLDEQETLRRVATLIARGASPDAVFVAVCDEAVELFGAEQAAVVRLDRDGPALVTVGLSAGVPGVTIGMRSELGDWPTSTAACRTGRTARTDVTAEEATGAGTIPDMVRAKGFLSTVSAPIAVEGCVWGAMTVSDSRHALAPDTERRIENFTELIATAIANREARDQVTQLLDVQSSLRRIATLVARGPAAEELFSAVAREVAGVLGASSVLVEHFGPDGTATTIGAAGLQDGFAATSTVAVPIVVGGRVWGTIDAASAEPGKLPKDAEGRMGSFAELLATAIENIESREALAASEARARALANEQAALRRVAMLASRESSPVEVLEAVAEEAARVLEVDAVGMIRFDPGDTATLVAQSETPWDPPPLGTRLTLDGENVITAVHRTGQVARMDDWENASGSVAELATVLGVTSAVASPIVVQGRLWGTMIAATNQRMPLPKDTEPRIVEFTELLATAISNAESREALMGLAEEQAALRRVATLVARGASPNELFSAVADEVAGIIDIPAVGVHRYEADGTFTMLGAAGETRFTVGSRRPVESDGIAGQILATCRPAREDGYPTMPGRHAEALSADRMISTVGVPIVVDGSIWGFMVAAGRPGRPIPNDAEQRLVRFTELVATAVSNATTRTELLTSRARLVSAADETRRRLERDLHDGIQQWLVALALRARKAARLSAAGEPAVQELSGLADDLVSVTDELREIARGIHPAILSDAGLDDALESLARRSALRVELDVSFGGRFDPTLEATVYYVVAESITNAAKHARASKVAVRGGLRGGAVELEIKDDGVGGADPSRGSGLIGLEDRIDTLGGTISLASPPGAGTTIRVRLPASASG